MSHYFIAQIKIRDREEYQKYLDACDAVFSKYNGEYLAVDETPEVLEGKWEYERIVLIRFPNETELRRWYNSPDYQQILKFRLAAADNTALLVKGLDE